MNKEICTNCKYYPLCEYTPNENNKCDNFKHKGELKKVIEGELKRVLDIQHNR